MSRAYDFQVDVYPVKDERQLDQVRQELDIEVSGTVESYLDITEREDGFNACLWSNDSSLCGGESDNEAHERIVGRLKDKFPFLKEVVTSWRCMEYLEWDEVHTWEKKDG